MFAFLCGESAIESVRYLSVRGVWQEAPPWPDLPRMLPLYGDCVSTQRDFKQLARETDLSTIGLVKSPVDLLVPNSRLRSQGKGAAFHVWSSTVPVGACRRVALNLAVSGPEFAILQLCGSYAKFDAYFDEFVKVVKAESELIEKIGEPGQKVVAEWPQKWEQRRRIVAATVLACEFAGSYRLGRRGDGSACYGCESVMTAESLQETLSRATPNPATRRARTVADLMLEGSASPMETALALMLTLPVEYGGFGIRKPQLNADVCIDGAAGALRSVRPDLLWQDEHLALEYDSAEFHANRGASSAAVDAARSNALTASGYHVLRATDRIAATLEGLDLLAHQIALLLNQELEEPDELKMQRRRRIHIELFQGGGASR